ncbi:MAG: hypothetical protein RL038_157, partial [Actinomycetota bacterium]
MTSVLLITSNGWGLGHLIRQLAIANALPAEVRTTILTLSGGAAIAATENLEYAPSYSQPWITRADWHGGYLRDRILALASEVNPTHIVFDGVVPYLGLLDALRQLPARKVWVRRGLWRADANPKPLRETKWFDLVIEPGDLGDALDIGPTKNRNDALKVGVITEANLATAHNREAAAAALGVDPNKPTLLLNLGSSAIGDLQPLADVLQRFPEWQILSTKDELGRTKGFDESRVIQLTGIFPLHPYLKAVDLAITSVGYNAAHEFVAMNVPAIYVAAPNVTDDQQARANAIAKLKAGWSASPDAPEELAALLNQILTGGASTLAAVQANCEIATAGFGDGAAAAASAILKSSAAAKPSFMMQSRLLLRLR